MEEKEPIEPIFSDSISKLLVEDEPLPSSPRNSRAKKTVLKITARGDAFFSPELARILKRDKFKLKEDFAGILLSGINRVSHYRRKKAKKTGKVFYVVSSSELHRKLFSLWVEMITGFGEGEKILFSLGANYRFPISSLKKISTKNMIKALSESARRICEGEILLAENLESTAIALVLAYSVPKTKKFISFDNSVKIPCLLRTKPKEGEKSKKKKIKVLCDFDGTITKKDVSVALLDRFTGGRWRNSVKSVVKGNIGSKQAYRLVKEEIKGKLEEMRNFVRNYGEVEDGFAEFVNFLSENGIGIDVVSDGFGFYIKEILGKHGIKLEFFSAELVEENGKFDFTFPNESDFCKLCATCKLKILRENRDFFTVFIGNGISDRCAVEESDVVFAKSRLKEICYHKGVDFFPFENFHDILGVFQKNPECFIIDFDGTIAWSFEGILESFRYTFRKLGIPMPSGIERLIGLPLIECFRITVGDDLAETALGIFREKYKKVYLKKTYLAPGVKITLSEMKKLGFKIAVLSNKSGMRLRELIGHLGISDYVDVAVGEGDIKGDDGAPVMKPSRRTVEFIAEKLGTDPRKVVVVGDTEVDMETARNSSSDFIALYSVMRPPSFFEEKGKVLGFISSFSGLRKIARFFSLTVSLSPSSP